MHMHLLPCPQRLLLVMRVQHSYSPVLFNRPRLNENPNVCCQSNPRCARALASLPDPHATVTRAARTAWRRAARAVGRAAPAVGGGMASALSTATSLGVNGLAGGVAGMMGGGDRCCDSKDTDDSCDVSGTL